MTVEAIQTRIVQPPKDDLEEFLSSSLPKLQEDSIIVISSKVVAICEGDCIPHNSVTKDQLVLREADQVLLSRKGKKQRVLTLRRGLLIGSAGVDESNAGDYYIVLPRHPYASARRIWKFVRKAQGIKETTSIAIVTGFSGVVFYQRGVSLLKARRFGYVAPDIDMFTPLLHNRLWRKRSQIYS